MVDKPDRESPRFPLDKVPIAEAEIVKALDQLGAGPEDHRPYPRCERRRLDFCEACLKHGVTLQLMQPFPEPEFIERSVAPAEGDWRSRFFEVKAKLHPTRLMHAQ